MTQPNPYESPAAKSQPRAWRTIDFFVAGIWLAIPTGVYFGRRLLLPIFMDFDVALPTATQYLLHFYSGLLFAIASMTVLITLLSMPDGRARRALQRMFLGISLALADAGAKPDVTDGLLKQPDADRTASMAAERHG